LPGRVTGSDSAGLGFCWKGAIVAAPPCGGGNPRHRPDGEGGQGALVFRSQWLGKPRPFNGGVRSPPLCEMAKRCGERLPGGKPRDGARGGFSEGRTPCARIARLNECRGIPFPPDACAKGRDPKGENPPRSQCPHYGRAEPAPPRGGRSKLGRPSGANPGITRRAVFSEGRTLCVRVVRTDSSPRCGMTARRCTKSRWPGGDMSRLGSGHS
jgi:hypothetical protein